ncbi:MAG: APC family permease [Hyphomicrobiaceae bacterium]
MLVLYGLGVTVGAGIYTLIGAAAARAGSHAPVAFLMAAAIMALTAASFAELAGRVPVSGSEAAYVRQGLRSKRLALIVGLMVVTAGIISAAAITRGAAGYIAVFVNWPDWAIVTAVVLAMGLIAAWGISQAVGVAAALTLIEVGGLLAVIAAGFWKSPAILLDAPQAVYGLSSGAAWSGVFNAALLAFFAFIGFEGMVNVAEEVQAPERAIPRAILVVMILSTTLYMLVVWVSIHAVPREELATSSAPLSLVFERVTHASPTLINSIAIVATINGVIVQMVMSSRVIYGMARQKAVPAPLGAISSLTQTPLVATTLVIVSVLLLALAFPIELLADATSRVILVIFAFVNASLVAIKRRKDPAPSGTFVGPEWVPIVGTLSCIGLLAADLLL